MKKIYEYLLNLIQTGEPGMLVTVTEVSGSVPRHVGSKMVVHGDGRIFGSIGGGKIELDVISDALQLMQQTTPLKRSYQLTEKNMLCGGQVEILFEPLGRPDKLFIFGAGHIGQTLAPLAHQAGFQVTVVDNRPEFANRERFPAAQADRVLAGAYQVLLPQLIFDDQTFSVIVTHGHAHDEEILNFCLRKPFRYLGMIGSKRKIIITLERLAAQGIDKSLLDRVHSPIGLRIGAETPFEIAISILSELIATRHQVDVSVLSMKSATHE